LQAVRPRAGER